MGCINSHFGKISSLYERNKIIRELVDNGYDIKLQCRAARDFNENVTVFYNPATFQYMLLFKDSFTDFYCNEYLNLDTKIVL